MATRMQQRRGTAAQWVSTNNGDGPILEAGEIGFETDTGKFKIGDGLNHWVDLDYFLDESDITGITGDYVLANTLGQANGVATLDANAKLTASQIPGIDELAQDAVDMALVAGTGISKTYNDNANTITIAVDTSVIATKAELAEVSQDSLNDALTAGTGISKTYDDNANTLTVAVDTSVIQARVSGVSDTEIGYLANVTSDIQTQLNSKASSTDLSNHESDTSNVHGISDTTVLVKTTDTGTVTSTMIANGTIVNDDINASAAIALSKLATDPLARANHTGTQLASTISDFDEAAQDAVGGILGSGLTYTDASNTITVDSTVVQLRVANVTDTEIGYLDGVTSNVQAQIDSKAALAGATFTGNVVVEQNFQVDGNFTVNGSNVLVSATQIQIEDSIIQIAHENPANTVDLGLVAGYNDGTAKHAGLVKDATDGKWKLFDGVTDEPATTVNFAQASYDDLVVGGLEASSLTVGDVSNTEFGYLANVTSDIQSQIDGKISASSTDTLLNKTVNLANNTVTGTIAQFNTALSDADFATLSGTETLSNKTLSSPTVTVVSPGVAEYGSSYFTGTGSFNFNTDYGGLTTVSLVSYNPSTKVLVVRNSNSVSGWIPDTLHVANFSGTSLTNISSPAINIPANPSIVTVASSGGFATTTINIANLTTQDITNVETLVFKLWNGSAPTTKAFSYSSNASAITVSATEISYLDGVTSAIQTQIDTKAPLASPTFTGTVTLPTGTVTSGMILDGTIVNADINASAAIAQSKVANLTTDLAAKAPLASPTFTGTVTLPNTTSIGNVSSTEIGYLGGVVSNIQNQIDSKAPYADTISATSTNTLTNKTINLTNNTITGTVAQFNSALSDANFITTTDTATVTNAMLAGSIANNKLANSAITINGSAVALGGTITIASEPTLHTVFAMV